MTTQQDVEAWKALGSKIQAIAIAMSEAADPQDKDGEKGIVKLWAVALLCRTTNHFLAMQLLLGDKLIVEARTIVRCMYENLFRSGYLVVKGYEAVKTWLTEYDASNKATGNALLKWTRDHGAEEIEEFFQFMENLNKQKFATSSMEVQAMAAGLHDHYITYRVLSADSAHPTARMLSRHARVDKGGSLTISGASLWENENEETQTRALACLAFLFILFGVNHLLDLGYKSALSECSNECTKLHAETVAA